MAGRVLNGEVPARHVDRLAAVEHPEISRRHRRHAPPQRLHAITVDALGAREQLGRVDEMRRTFRVYPDLELRKALYERAGRTRVVQVNMREKQRLRLRGEALQKRLHAAFGARIDDRTPQVPGADHALAVELMNVDQR